MSWGVATQNGVSVSLACVATLGFDNSGAAPAATFAVLSSAGVSYSTTRNVLSSSGVSYAVSGSVLSSSGVSYNVI